MNLLNVLTGWVIFNFIGACVRWTFGTIWRTLANKKKIKFKEYLHGPENSDDWFDFAGHEFVNRVIGMLTIVGLVLLILRLEI